MNTEEKPTTKPKNTGLGLLLLGASGACFFFAWQVFQSIERNNLGVLQACGDASKGLGQETLNYYGECVNQSQFGSIGAWVLILVGVVLGIIGLANLASKSD